MSVYPAETGISKLEVEYDGKQQPEEGGISFTPKHFSPPNASIPPSS